MPIAIPSFRKTIFLSPWIDHVFPKLTLLKDSCLTDEQKGGRPYGIFMELIGYSCCRLGCAAVAHSFLLIAVC